MKHIAVLLSLAVAVQAADTRLAWSELGAVAVEKRAAIPLPGGKRVEGEILAVRDDGIVMDIRKTRDRANYPPGQGFIPRASVTEVRVIRHKGPMKLVGGIAGTAAGLLAVGAIGVATGGAGVIPALVLLWPAAGMGGYYAGRAADRRTRVIRVMP